VAFRQTREEAVQVYGEGDLVGATRTAKGSLSMRNLVAPWLTSSS